MDWNSLRIPQWFYSLVTPLAGVWIEIGRKLYRIPLHRIVTPLAGVWIEILCKVNTNKPSMSLPLRECGLKSDAEQTYLDSLRHSPCGSVDWNSTYNAFKKAGKVVTPLAGVWIEIILLMRLCQSIRKSLPLRECGLKFICYATAFLVDQSLPLRECGLKLGRMEQVRARGGVTPLAGVWIEICGTFFVILCKTYKNIGGWGEKIGRRWIQEGDKFKYIL